MLWLGMPTLWVVRALPYWGGCLVMSDRKGPADGLVRAEAEKGSPGASQGAVDRPSELGRRHWWGAVKRTVAEYRVDNLSDWAAALTYYAVLSIFPALLVLVSAIGLAGHSATQSLLDNLGQLAPGSVRQVLGTAISNLQNSQRSAGVLVVVSLLVALWSASGYIAAFMRASNAIYDVPEGRPVWKTVPIRIAVTVVTLVLLSASAVAVVVTGGLAGRVGRVLGIGSTAVTIWNIAKWPVLLVIVSFMFALLYWASPNAKQGFRWVTPGGVLAVVVWVVASAAFAFYVANFGSYNKTYGSLAGVIVFLVWLWISNLAILLGAELNAELERGRGIAAGQPPQREPYMELRDRSRIRERDNL
jgi:membrane protein